MYRIIKSQDDKKTQGRKAESGSKSPPRANCKRPEMTAGQGGQVRNYANIRKVGRARLGDSTVEFQSFPCYSKPNKQQSLQTSCDQSLSKLNRVTDAKGVDEIAWGEYAGKRGRKQGIMGHETHSHGQLGQRNRTLEKLAEEKPKRERKTMMGGRLATDP